MKKCCLCLLYSHVWINLFLWVWPGQRIVDHASDLMSHSALLNKKLQKTQMDYSTSVWIIDYLTERPQMARLCFWAGGQHQRNAAGSNTFTVYLLRQLVILQLWEEIEHMGQGKTVCHMIWEQSPWIACKQDEKESTDRISLSTNTTNCFCLLFLSFPSN